MKLKPDQERVKNLLSDTVALLCKNGLAFEKELKIQGLLGVTIDDNDVFIVHLNERYTGLVDEPAEPAPVASKESARTEQSKSKDSRNEGATKRPHPSPMRSHSQSPHTPAESKRPRPSSHLQSPHRRASHSSSNDSVVVQVKQEKEDDIELVEAKLEPNFGYGNYGAHGEMGGPHGKRRTDMFPANAQEPFITGIMRTPATHGEEPGTVWDPNSSQPSSALAHDSQLDATSGSSQWNPALGLPPGSEGLGEYSNVTRRPKRFFCDEPGCEKGYYHNYELLRHLRSKHNIVTGPRGRGKGNQQPMNVPPPPPQRPYVQQQKEPMGPEGGPPYHGQPMYDDMPYDWFDDEEYDEEGMMEYDPEMDDEEEYYTSDDDLELLSEEPSGSVGHLIVKTETGDIVHPGSLGFGGHPQPAEPTIRQIIPLNRQQQQQQQGGPRYRMAGDNMPRQFETYSPQGKRQNMGPPGPRMGSPQFRQNVPEQVRMRGAPGTMQQRPIASPSRQYPDNQEMTIKSPSQQRNIQQSAPMPRNVLSPMGKAGKQPPMPPVDGQKTKPVNRRNRGAAEKTDNPKSKGKQTPSGEKTPVKRQPRGKAALKTPIPNVPVTDACSTDTKLDQNIPKLGKGEKLDEEKHQQQSQVSTTHLASKAPPPTAPASKVSSDDGVSSSSPAVVTAEADQNIGEPDKHLVKAIKEEARD